MQYLDRMGTVMGDTRAWWPVVDTVKHSQVRYLLEDKGYKTIFFASGWDYTEFHDGDAYLSPYPINFNNFQNTFLLSTNLRGLADLESEVIAWPSYDTARQIMLNNFHTIPEIASTPGPKFVFSHILAGHFPFVFDRLGNPVNPDYPYTFIIPTDKKAYSQGYAEQLLYINEEILRTVDGILANSSTPPIIILQADHGPGLLEDTDAIENTFLYEHFSILNAIYLPGIDQENVPEFVTPVNTFRTIFTLFFQANLEILPNKQFFSSDDIFYHFLDVTGETQTIGK